MTAITTLGSLAMLSTLLLLGGCKSLDVENLNGVAIEGIQTAPTPNNVNTAAQGVMALWRTNSNGHAQTLTKHGFEHWQIRASEPRTLSGIVRDPQTGGFWSYGGLADIDVLLKAVDAVSGLTDAQKEGVRGWAKTVKAVLLEDMIQAHDTFGIVIDLPANPAADVPPIVGRTVAWTRIFQLLDQADTHLAAAGTAFSFRLSTGFAGFNTPTNFRRVNRALKARYQVYTNDYAGALTSIGASFIDASAAGLTATGLRRGPMHVYTTATGDATNTLNSADRYANTRIRTEAQRKVDGVTLDQRAIDKVRTVASFTFGGVTTDLKHTDFYSPGLELLPTSPLPIIRNEELILLRAEANLACVGATGPAAETTPVTCSGSGAQRAAALADINLIRVNSGGLAPIAVDPGTGGPLTGDLLLDELLYNKRYSLWGEIGTVWLDMRHYSRILQIPRYLPTFLLWDVFPIPTAECEVRGYNTRGCFLGGLAGK